MATNDNGYIIIEGNIGVGKSTFSRILADAFITREKRAEYLIEPDDKMNPFLAAYYADPKGTAYKMQMHLLHRRFRDTRYAQVAAIDGRGWYILDRSYYGDICFAHVQSRLGLFTEAENDSYLAAHRNMREFIEPPTVALFLHASPETCNSRIRKRARNCEPGIELGYLQALQDEIDKLECVLSGRCKVLSLDWEPERSEAELEALALGLVDRVLAIHRDDWDF